MEAFNKSEPLHRGRSHGMAQLPQSSICTQGLAHLASDLPSRIRSGAVHLPWNIILSDSEQLVRKLFSAPGNQDVVEIQNELSAVARRDADFGEEEVVRHRAKLDAEKASWQDLEQIFQKIRQAKLNGGPMPREDFDRLADRVNPRYNYTIPRTWFRPVHYASFEDWFLRELADETKARCFLKAQTASVCAPCQGLVLNQVLGGLMTLKISVIAVEALHRLVDGDRLIQFALRKTDYHRVHCPVDGTLEDLIAYEKDQLFPGAEAMTILTFRSDFGAVKLLCIGEWSVQSFVVKPSVVKGVPLRKLDEVGHFDFGSQVILVLPITVRMIFRGGEKAFPGDPVAVLASNKKSAAMGARKEAGFAVRGRKF